MAGVTWEESERLFAGVDVVVDGTDTTDIRYVISARCARLGIPHVWASILGYEAQLSVFHAGHGPIYEDAFPTPPLPGAVPSCAHAGVLGPIVGVVGSAMAMETLKLIAGIGDPLRGTIGYYDGLSGRWEYIPLVADPDVAARVVAEPPRHSLRVPITDTPTGVRYRTCGRRTNTGAAPCRGDQCSPSDLEAGCTAGVPDGAVLFCHVRGAVPARVEHSHRCRRHRTN